MNNDNWAKLSIKDKSELIRLFIRSGIKDLNQMIEYYNNFDTNTTYSNGGNLFFAGGVNDTNGDNPPAQFEYTPKDYSYLFSRDYQLQQQAEQIKKQQDNTIVAKPIIANPKEEIKSKKDNPFKQKIYSANTEDIRQPKWLRGFKDEIKSLYAQSGFADGINQLDNLANDYVIDPIRDFNNSNVGAAIKYTSTPFGAALRTFDLTDALVTGITNPTNSNLLNAGVELGLSSLKPITTFSIPGRISRVPGTNTYRQTRPTINLNVRKETLNLFKDLYDARDSSYADGGNLFVTGSKINTKEDSNKIFDRNIVGGPLMDTEHFNEQPDAYWDSSVLEQLGYQRGIGRDSNKYYYTAPNDVNRKKYVDNEIKERKSIGKKFTDNVAQIGMTVFPQLRALNAGLNLLNKDFRNKSFFNKSPLFGATISDYANSAKNIVKDAFIQPFFRPLERDSYEQQVAKQPQSIKNNGEMATRNRYANKLFENTGDKNNASYLIDNGDGTYRYPYSALITDDNWKLDSRQFSSDLDTNFTIIDKEDSPLQRNDWLFRQAGHWGSNSKVYTNPNNSNEFMLDLYDNWDLHPFVDWFASNKPFKTHNQIPIIKKGNDYYLNVNDTLQDKVKGYLKYPVKKLYTYKFN